MPAFAEALLLLPALATLTILTFGMAYWVYRDASRRGSERAVAWGVPTIFLGFVALAFYLLARRDLDGPDEPPTRSDRLVRNVVVAAFLTFVVAGVVGPPDPITTLYNFAIALPLLLALAVLYTYRDVLASAI